MRLIVPQRWPAIRGLGDDTTGDYSTVGDDPTINLQDTYLPTLTSVGLDTSPGYTGGAIPPGSGSGLTAAQIASILGTAANTATSVYKATQSPYLIPGTNIIANPGGTPIVGANSALSSSSLSSISPLLIILVIGGIVVMNMGKH